MKPLGAKAVIRILMGNGFIVSRQHGSHVILKEKISGLMVSVPLHGSNKPLPIGTLLAIVKQSHIPKDKFK